HWIAYTAAFSVALGVAGATKDITIDGWRITSVPVAKQSVMTAISEMGYRVGTLAAGAGALLLADRYGWRFAYLGMAALMTVGAISAFVAPEPESDFTAPHKHRGFAATVISPIKEMVGRLGPLALPILLMVAGFRMPGYLSSAMSLPLFKSLDYSDTEIATVTKLFGFWVALGATFFSAYIIRRIGFPSQPRLALRKRRRPFLDLRRCGQHRRVRLRFRAGRADQLHVDAHRDGTCRQPIRASHLAMRFSRKHPRRRLWLRDRENWIHDIFRAELTDRNPGGGAVLVCVASARKCDTRPGEPWIRLIAAQSHMGAS